MQNPLDGVRVLDLTNVLAGPFCCHHLVHLGAEVIKVEAVGTGDLARQLGADPELNARGMGISFLAQNAGKKSVTVNLKDERGKELFLRLVESADVVVENFRPGVMQRLGLDYEVLQCANARLIYCAISGFGQTGPWVDRPAYDQIIQGISGAMSVTGTSGETPTRTGFPIADTVGGLTAAFAIAAALNARPRGTYIDVSMLESLLASMGWVLSNYLIGGVTPAAHGNENPTSAPSGTFEAADGLLNIAANKEEQWVLLTDHLNRAELRARAEFATREARKQNRGTLKAELEVSLKTRPAQVWVDELNRIGVPAGPVLSVPEILQSQQIAERGFLNGFDAVPGVDRDIQLATTGIKLDGVAPSVVTPPPELGADSEAVWSELGLSVEAQRDLRQKGVI